MLSDCDSNLDLFWTLESYMKDNKDSHWFDKHQRLIQLFGKALRPNPGVVILRSGESNLLDPQAMGYNWDLGRSELQAAHYDNFYATEWELARGLVRDYPVLMDSGSQFMDARLVRDIGRYVEAGGTFIALHNTGLHGILEPNTSPLSQISGFMPSPTRRGGEIRFADQLPVFNGWEGQRFKASGLALKPVAGLAGLQPLARWEDGSVAVGYRQLGKGRIIVLGYSSWRDGQDTAGVWRSRLEMQDKFLSRLFTDLGVERTANASSYDVWARKAVTKNGLQDWLITCNSTDKPVTADVSLLVEHKPQVVWNLVTRRLRCTASP